MINIDLFEARDPAPRKGRHGFIFPEPMPKIILIHRAPHAQYIDAHYNKRTSCANIDAEIYEPSQTTYSLAESYPAFQFILTKFDILKGN